MIRAKFRIMTASRHWDGSTSLNLLPVNANGDDVDAEENKLFWDATPAGEMSISFAPDDEPDWMSAGGYVFLDLEENVDGGVEARRRCSAREPARPRVGGAVDRPEAQPAEDDRDEPGGMGRAPLDARQEVVGRGQSRIARRSRRGQRRESVVALPGAGRYPAQGAACTLAACRTTTRPSASSL